MEVFNPNSFLNDCSQPDREGGEHTKQARFTNKEYLIYDGVQGECNCNENRQGCQKMEFLWADSSEKEHGCEIHPR